MGRGGAQAVLAYLIENGLSRILDLLHFGDSFGVDAGTGFPLFLCLD